VINCPNCAARCPDDLKLCWTCGTNLETLAEEKRLREEAFTHRLAQKYQTMWLRHGVMAAVIWGGWHVVIYILIGLFPFRALGYVLVGAFHALLCGLPLGYAISRLESSVIFGAVAGGICSALCCTITGLIAGQGLINIYGFTAAALTGVLPGMLITWYIRFDGF